MNIDCKLYFLLISLLLLQACASNANKGIAPVPVEDRSVVDKNIGVEQYPPVSRTDDIAVENIESHGSKKPRNNSDNQPMVVALLKDADEKISSGNSSGAAATLERALRLDPKNAMLWHRLGLLRLQQKNWQQAINLAKKSNSLAAGEYVLQAANWRIVAQANSRAGNRTAAKLAAERATQLERTEQ